MRGFVSVIDPTESENITINGALQGMDSGTRKAGFVDLSVIVAGQTKEFKSRNSKSRGKDGKQRDDDTGLLQADIGWKDDGRD